MYRTEFLGILRSQLSGQMQEGKVAAHLRYYEDYIQSKVRSGINEEEVIDVLGDPRLIAKTLLDTDIDNGIYEEEASSSQGYSQSPYNGQSSVSSSADRRWYKKLDLSTWYGKLIVIAVAALVIFLLVTVLTAVAPFFLILALILFVLSKFRKR